jgi:hypothetical protein
MLTEDVIYRFLGSGFLFLSIAVGSVVAQVGISEKEWQLPKRAQAVSDDGQMLSLRKVKGTERVTSLTKYRFATLEFDMRIGRIGSGLNYYLGFMSRDPWAKNVVWLINDGGKSFFLRSSQDGKNMNLAGSSTGILEADRWYPVKLVWNKAAEDRLEKRSDTVTLFFDGKELGTFGYLDTMPNGLLPVVFDVVSLKDNAEASMDIRNIKITPHGTTTKEATTKEATTRAATTMAAATRAAVLNQEIPIPPQCYPLPEMPKLTRPTATLDQGLGVLENAFLECKLDLKALQIGRLLNKYTQSEMIHAPSRFFVINAQGKDVPNTQYELVDAQVSQDDERAEIRAQWRCRASSFRVDMTFTLRKDSPEMLISLEAKNEGSELMTLGITAPFIENIRIGDQVEDDWFFFPMKSGWCGKLPTRMRHAYGYMAWMQLLAVFDPEKKCGVFAYCRDDQGAVKNLLVNKRHQVNEEPVPSSTGGFSEDDPGKIFNSNVATAMAVRHLRYELPAGEFCKLPQAVIGVSRGDWHDPFDHYRKWVRSWFTKRFETPRWYLNNYNYISRHPHAGHPIGFMDKDETRYVYAENMGPNEVGAMTEWGFWWDYPLDTFNNTARDHQITKYSDGDYDYSSRRGGLPAFREEIRRIHEKGGRLQLYNLAVALADNSRIGKEHGASWGRKGKSGKYTTDWVAPGHGYNACLYVGPWQDYLSKRLATILKESGADSVRLDVAAAMYPCFNEEHEHYKGTIRSAVDSKAMGTFLLKCSTEARAVNPEAAVGTEHAGTEYFAQFIDGSLTQQFRHDSPLFGRFRGMNGHQLVFMRFLLPELKFSLFGFDKADGGKRSFFNVVGQDRGGADAETIRYMTRTHRVLIENGDAVNTLRPEPLVPTLQNGLQANAFPGEHKRVWTLWNRTSEAIQGELLVVAPRKNVHYMEMLHDVPLVAQSRNGQTIISGRLEAGEVVCIAELPPMLRASVKGETLTVHVNGHSPDMRLAYFTGPDDQHLAKYLPLKGGSGSAHVPNAEKLIVKLIKGDYLLDQIVLP